MLLLHVSSRWLNKLRTSLPVPVDLQTNLREVWSCLGWFLNVRAVVASFNQEKAQVGASPRLYNFKLREGSFEALLSSPLCVPRVTPGQNIVILWHSVGHGGPQELCHEIREYWSAFIAENRGKFRIIWISEYSETKYRRYLCVERSPVWSQCHSSLFAQKRTLKWLPSVKMAIKLNLDCFKLSFGNSRRFPTVLLCRVLNASNITNVYEMTFWCPETFKRNGSAQHWNNYFYLNALFWPIFDAAINHKHHDFGVDKSERADYGHYWTISKSDLVVKNAAGRWAGGWCQWISRAEGVWCVYLPYIELGFKNWNSKWTFYLLVQSWFILV